ncbi:hypothetical protein DFP72DRAFT_975457 [Ephemerocybe angulata]|uniref:Uncharacterized protein n=1 Tax=Ephemerocybe angulata TaxID=980116 RepID=A0A8H6HC43_9AGAR|nr:hypothetical protein DFP72DRAFT_975457 [Tulosesus angulatus]
MSDRAIAVIEPTRTRKIQIALACSIVASLLVIRVFPSTDDPSPAGVIGPFIALLTLPHHLTIIVLAFRQRRRLYTPEEIPHLVPVTAKAAVVLTSWLLCCAWAILSMFYLMDLGAPRHKTLFFLSSLEGFFVFMISALTSQDRLDLLARQDAQPTSLMFMVDENGEAVAMEGP